MHCEQIIIQFGNDRQDLARRSGIRSCYSSKEIRQGSLYQPPVHLYKKLIFLKARLAVPFFILTASEMQMDFCMELAFFPFVLGGVSFCSTSTCV